MGDWIFLIIGIAVLGVVALVGLVARVATGRRGRVEPPRGGTDVIAPPPDAADADGRPSRGRRRRHRRRRAAGPGARAARGHRVAPGPAAPAPRRARRAAWAAACSPCSRATGSTRTPGSRSRTPCSPPTSASPPPRSWSSGCAPGCASRARTPDDPRTVLREELLTLVDPTMDRRLQVSGADGAPGVVLVVGVNGAGKTTTVGKIARILVAEDRSVVLGAADTFRAAAVEQLATWGERVGVDVVRGPEGTDPASVAFEAVKEGVDTGVDTVIVDTAGRLQNKAGLMDELGKVKRVIEKQAPVTEVLLVLDATTGQNGLIQARVFSEVVERHRHRAHQARRLRQGRHRRRGPARARRPGQARRPRRGRRRPGAVRRRRLRRRLLGCGSTPRTRARRG